MRWPKSPALKCAGPTIGNTGPARSEEHTSELQSRQYLHSFPTRRSSDLYLLTGPLEPTNRAYALAKIAGIEMCWSYNRQYGTRYLAAMPTNMYGPGDNYNLETSHVLPALIRKVYEARCAGRSEVVVWGSGKPLREFMYSDDFADACVYLMTLDDQSYGTLLSEDHPPLINVGYGSDVTIRELAETVCRVLGFEGKLVFDASKPDGTPRKLMDSSRLRALGWRPKIDLETGIRLAYDDFLKRSAKS